MDQRERDEKEREAAAEGAGDGTEGAAIDGQDATADTPQDDKEGQSAPEGHNQNPVERLYDKIPLSFRQVDLIVKALIGAFVLFLLFIVWQGLR